MPIITAIRAGLYKDSVALMRIAEAILALPDVHRATLVMASPANLEILLEAKMADPSARAAAPNDLLIVVDAATAEAAASAIAEAERRLVTNAPINGSGGHRAIAPKTVTMGMAEAPLSRLAQISVPGPYAAAEAMKALRAGLNVFLFSDNVPIEQERIIKMLARDKGLIVMGPDCGTAIIAGVPLGFANVVRRGAIGIVAASGTGLQEVSTQIHLLGGGISHAIGTGGRDVSPDIGGISMLAGLDALGGDAATQVIVIVAKPPAPTVMAAVMAKLAQIGKPAVVCFLGAELAASDAVHPVNTLYKAAARAVELAGGTVRYAYNGGKIAPPRFAPSQKYLRALLSGGTYCAEAQVIWKQIGISAWSNVPLDKSKRLADSNHSIEHTIVDLGEDEFTIGKPHPMIDMSTRIERIQREASDPSTAVLLLDVVLGYGAHHDPAGALAPAIAAARATAARVDRELPVVCFVCGTDDDPQGLSAQRTALTAVGAIVAPNSAAGAGLAATLLVTER